MPKKLFTILILFIIIALAAFGYYFFFMMKPVGVDVNGTGGVNGGGFNPFGRGSGQNNTSGNGNGGSNNSNTDTGTSTIDLSTAKIPVLRQLSTTPVGGMGASSSATTSIVRFIDRGLGHISQASDATLAIDKLSNTTLTRVYESYWNRDLTGLVIRYLKEDSDAVVNFYAELRPIKTTAVTGASTTTIADSATSTPYELRGAFLPTTIREIAVSPKRDALFTWDVDQGKGTGYIGTFDQKKRVALIDTPLTQVNIDWPETTTITLNTKAGAKSAGFLYFINTKTGDMKKIIGGINGLNTKTNHDASKVLVTVTDGDAFSSSIYTVKTGATDDAVFRTLAEKCVWSSLHIEDLYCAVPIQVPSAVYPDDWYQGKVSFTDQIWHLDTRTGEVHLIANLLSESKQLIDAINLTLDPKENFLYFMNKNDLTVWSLDLTR